MKLSTGRKEAPMTINDFAPLIITLLICGDGFFMIRHDEAIDRENEAEKEKQSS